MIRLSIRRVTTLGVSRSISGFRRHESCELARERFHCPIAPAIGDGLGPGIWEDFLFVLLQRIENAPRRGFWRSLRYVEASVHIGIDGAQDDGPLGAS